MGVKECVFPQGGRNKNTLKNAFFSSGEFG